jgi:hypothetical protein
VHVEFVGVFFGVKDVQRVVGINAYKP